MAEMKIITTSEKEQKYWAEEKKERIAVTDCMHVINVHPDVTDQTFHGFGAALTEAAAHVYGRMGEEKQREILEACFGESGLRYNIGRIHMNSCDFGLGNYTYIEEGDDSLETFDIAHDRKEILPFIAAANRVAGERSGNLEFLMSPWSPPAFFKTNGEMNHGGSLKKDYYQRWADYFVRFIKAYRAEGVNIRWLTVQNEPMAVQTWDSCIYTAEEEALFVRDYLGPTLEKEGLSDVEIFVWDHNKEEGYARFRDVMADKKTADYVKGEALHWYTGDHFEAIELVRKKYPDKEIFFTEGCVEYSRFADSGEIQKAEMYAHDILGNLNAGINASLDWNILLDEKGGPNHVGNFCAAPIMCTLGDDTFEKRLSYYYIGQFSRYIAKDAKRLGTTRYTDAIEVTGFLNPDDTRVIVLLNKGEKECPYTLREDGMGVEGKIAPHSIQTIVYRAD